MKKFLFDIMLLLSVTNHVNVCLREYLITKLKPWDGKSHIPRSSCDDISIVIIICFNLIYY